MTLGMINCTNSGSSVVCTLNLLLIGLGLTNVGVICWLEDGSVKSSSAVLSAVPCVAILSGLVGCVSQFYHGCLPLHIATVLASIVLLLGGFCVITARKDDVVSQIIQSGENYDVASGVVSWSQILFLLMVCNQVAVLLSVCLFGCCDVFSRQKAKARKRDFARHFHRFVGGCPHPSAEGFPGSRASKNGALPASRAPNWRVPSYADNTAVADSCQSNECGEIEHGSPSAAARVPIRPACTVELRSLAQSGTDTHTRVPGVGLSYMPPVPLSMDLIMTTIQHSGNTGLESPGLKTFEEAHVARAYAVVEDSPAESDVENPDSDGAASNFESPCRSISPSLHSAKSELLTDIQEATLNMRNRMPDPDFFAISARTCFRETTENEMSSDEVC